MGGFPSRPDAWDQTPDSIGEVVALQKKLGKVLPAALKTLVSLQTDSKQGSGVLVSSSGVIYTAAHVVHDVDEKKRCTVIFHDGKILEGTLIAEDKDADVALVKISPQKEADCPMAAVMPRVGEWVFSLGHAGGYDAGRGAVVRLGRVVSIKNGLVQTDCKLIAGDSGGGLFNMKGELVAIHSKVGAGLDDNVHVPVSVFQVMDKTRS